MDKSLRVGIIGAGRIAELGHLPGYQRAGAQVVALCGTDAENLQRLGRAFGVERCTTDWHSMLAAGGLDAVSICTPPALHAEMAIACAQHGYHVLVEKPMATSLTDCHQMIAAAGSANVLLMVAHNQRFSERHRIAKEILDSGRLGRPYAVHGAFAHGGPENWSPNQTWYFDGRAPRFGVMADLGSHKIDLLRWLLQQEVTELSAFDTTFEKATTVDDTAVLALRFSGGTLATLYVGWTHRPDYVDHLTIQCERGTLFIPTDAAQPVRLLESSADGATVETTFPFGSEDGAGWWATVAAFVAAVTHRHPSPISGADGKATMAAVLAAYEAVTHKSVVQLNPISFGGL